MILEEFKSMYMCEFKPIESRAYKAVREYHMLCEDYDRTVCSGMRGAEAVPRSNWELHASNSFADKQKKVCMIEHDVCDKEWKAAMKSYARSGLDADLRSNWGRG